jgi:hypothetical protein
MSGKRHAPAALYRREKTLGTHWIGGWMGLRDDLDTEVREKILCFYRGSNPDCAVCSQDTILTQMTDNCAYKLSYCGKWLYGRRYIENNIKMELREISFDNVNWTEVALDMIKYILF